MKVDNIRPQSFGLFFIQPAVANPVPEVVPAIVRQVGKLQSSKAENFMPRAVTKFLQTNSQIPSRDVFVLHEAILPDTKIRIVGLANKKGRFVPVKKTRDTGRKYPAKSIHY